MTKINRQLITILRAAITEALAPIGKEYDVKISTGSASFTASSMSMKLEIVALGDGGVERDLDAEAFTSYATLIGLKPEDLGKPVMLQGQPFTIAGYRPKARKNNIAIKSPEGKVYVTSSDSVKRALERAAAK